jgi:hypothetical protein
MMHMTNGRAEMKKDDLSLGERLKECDAGNEVKSSLQSTFVKLMTASKDIVSEAIAKLITRLNTESKVKHFFES